MLRGGDDRKARLNRVVGAAVSSLRLLGESLGPDHADDIETVLKTVQVYGANTEIVDAMRLKNQTIEQMDAAIKIDDGPALAAIARLRAAIGTRSQDTRFGLQVTLRDALGYGGMIHQFKNLVLRKDAGRAKQTNGAAESARDAIARYRALGPAPEEEAALKAIEAAAQAEIVDLRAGMYRTHGNTQTASLLISLAALIGMVALSLTVFWAIQRFAVRPAGRIAEGLRALAEGDTSIDLADQVNGTEIGEIARVSGIFRAALVRNKDMAEKQRAHVTAQEKMAAEQADLLKEQTRLHEEQQQVHRQSQLAQAERERLQAAVQTVIDNAVEGNLSSRIVETFEEPTLAALAAGVNRLMDTVTASLDELLGAIGRLARGDLTGRIEGHHAGDFAKLQSAVNSALAELSQLIARVTDGAGNILQEAEVFSDATVGLGERTERHSHQLETTTAALSHLSDTIRSVATHAQEATTRVTRVGDSSVEIKSVMNEANASLERIVKNSGKISKVTALLEAISFQTNLLALQAPVLGFMANARLLWREASSTCTENAC